MRCNKCDRHKDVMNIRIMGRGNPHAEVVFIGDYPHIEADVQGKSFVGDVPQILFNELKKCNMKVNEFYYTTLVKCSGENPLKKEIAACLPYLHYEIFKIRPKYIVVLGNEALKGLTKKSGITKYRGQHLDYTFDNGKDKLDVTLIPMISPSAVARSPKNRKMFSADILSLKQLIYQEEKQPEDIKHYCMDKTSLKNAVITLNRAVNRGMYIGWDIETEGFDYWRPDKKILTMAFSIFDEKLNKGQSFGIPLGHPESPFKKQWVNVIRLFEDVLTKGKIVPQNGKFDVKWVWYKTGIKTNMYHDTMLSSYILDENTPHNLAYLSQVWLNVPNYKSMVDQSKLAEEPLDLVLEYNMLDTHYTVRVGYKLERELNKKERLKNIFERVLMNSFEMFARAEIIGAYVDRSRLMERYKICIDNINRLQGLLDGYVSKEFTDLYLTKHYKTKPSVISPFNMNSSPQKAALLFDKPPVGLGLPVLLRTEGGNPSTSEEAIINLKDNYEHELLDIIAEYQGWEQHRKMFLSPWQNLMDSNNYMHPTFKMMTVTGRTSCSDPNLQQVPRDPFIRNIIGAPPGKVIIGFDYSQMELRCAAFIADEKNMKRIYQVGGDIHRTTAAGTTGKREEDVTKDERKKAKATNFGYVYGAWWTTYKRTTKVKYGIDLTDEEARTHRERFFETYPDLVKWHKKYKQMVHSIKKVISPLGRERRLPDIDSVDRLKIQEAEREAINSPIQGMGSDILLSAVNDFYNKYIKDKPLNYEVEIFMTIHDAVYLYVDDNIEAINKWAPRIKAELEDLKRLKEWYGVDFTVPIVVDGEVEKHWESENKIEFTDENIGKLTQADLDKILEG